MCARSPRTAIYDPALTVSMPAALSATSGMNAMAHCVEALYAQDGNPIVSLEAEEGIRALAASLPVVVKEPSNMEARSQAFYGAWLGGMVLGATDHGAASQAVPHSRRRIQSAALGDAYGSAAACDGVQRGRRAGCDGANRAGARRQGERESPRRRDCMNSKRRWARRYR